MTFSVWSSTQTSPTSAWWFLGWFSEIKCLACTLNGHRGIRRANVVPIEGIKYNRLVIYRLLAAAVQVQVLLEVANFDFWYGVQGGCKGEID